MLLSSATRPQLRQVPSTTFGLVQLLLGHCCPPDGLVADAAAAARSACRFSSCSLIIRTGFGRWRAFGLIDDAAPALLAGVMIDDMVAANSKLFKIGVRIRPQAPAAPYLRKTKDPIRQEMNDALTETVKETL